MARKSHLLRKYMAMTEGEFRGLRGSVKRLVDSPRFQHFILGVICLNAVTLGFETSAAVMQSPAGAIFKAFDAVALAIYCVELSLKMFAYRLRFFREGWNWFDLIIVGIALVPASGPLAVFRALRILRVLRLFSVVPQLRVVVEALLRAMPGMTSVIVVMSLVFYVAAVAATKLFSAGFPEWFGSLWRSAYSLFQIMTLESWSMGIVRPVMAVYPYAWIFFVPFIVVTSFAVLNLFIALLVNSMNAQHDAEIHKEAEATRAAAEDASNHLLREIAAMRSELAEIRKQLPK